MFHAVEWRGDKLGPHLQVSCGSSPTPLVWINCFLLYFLIIIFLLQKSYLTLCDDIDAPLHALLKLCSSFIQQKHITHLLMFYGCPKNIMVTQIDTVPILMKLSYLKWKYMIKCMYKWVKNLQFLGRNERKWGEGNTT